MQAAIVGLIAELRTTAEAFGLDLSAPVPAPNPTHPRPLLERLGLDKAPARAKPVRKAAAISPTVRERIFELASDPDRSTANVVRSINRECHLDLAYYQVYPLLAARGLTKLARKVGIR
jgi:hypothetical protein